MENQFTENQDEIENQISYKIRKAIFEVLKVLGPGLLESIYEEALYRELMDMGLEVKRQQKLNVIYKNNLLDLYFRVDLIVEDKVIIEIKSIDQILDVHKSQVLTYLKLSGIPLGILVNFNTNFLRDNENIFRFILTKKHTSK
jgi:GxxExxY protein